MKHTHLTKGYSLVEVLVASSVLLIATVGPLTIAAKGIQTAQFTREQVTATFLAQEGIEAVVAARNDSLIEAINDGDLSNSWQWTTDAHTAGISDCFSSAGCNMDFRGGDTTNTIVRCDPIENCAVTYSAGDTVPYGINTSGDSTQFTRVIQLQEMGPSGRDREVRVTSTVYWDSVLFGSLTQRVELFSYVFNIYE